MPKYSYNRDDVKKIVEMARQGIGATDISRTMNIPRTSILGILEKSKSSSDDWIKKYPEGTSDPVPDVTDVDFVRFVSSEPTTLKTSKKDVFDKPQVVSRFEGEFEDINPEQVWEETEKLNDRAIAKFVKQKYFDFHLPETDRPIGIAFVSDQHISQGAVDLKQMKYDAQLIESTPNLYAVLGGDGVDNHLKIRAAIMHAEMRPTNQWRLYNYYLSLFASSIILVISGNHDNWLMQLTTLDQVKELCSQNKLHYVPDEARLRVHLGTQQYDIVMRHQFRFNSALNLGHTVKRLYDMGEAPFDIGCVGHHHESHTESFNRHGYDRWAIRPGSYQIGSGYTRQFGFGESIPTCPTAILWPHRRQIEVFRDVETAAKFLNTYSKIPQTTQIAKAITPPKLQN